MTTQTKEKLILNEEVVGMMSYPLEQYLKSLKEKPPLISPSSACWRGYVGTWEIKDDNLYLIEIEGFLGKQWEANEVVDLSFIFPNQQKVFAEWFSGELKVPQGQELRYVNVGYGDAYERDLFISFKNGKVTGKREVDNLKSNKELKELKKRIIPPKISWLTRFFGNMKMW